MEKFCGIMKEVQVPGQETQGSGKCNFYLIENIPSRQGGAFGGRETCRKRAMVNGSMVAGGLGLNQTVTGQPRTSRKMSGKVSVSGKLAGGLVEGDR